MYYVDERSGGNLTGDVVLIKKRRDRRCFRPSIVHAVAPTAILRLLRPGRQPEGAFDNRCVRSRCGRADGS